MTLAATRGDAEAYIRDRIEASRSMEYNLDKALSWAVDMIVSISYRYNITPRFFRFSANKSLQREIERIIDQLMFMLDDYTCTLAVADHTDKKDDVIAYIGRETHGDTFSSRLSNYLNRFSKETEAAIVAALTVGIGVNKAKKVIKDNMKHPFANPLFDESKKKGDDVLLRLNTQTTYGVGRSNSSRNALKDLTRYAVDEGWMYYLWAKGRENRAVGFITFRASNYPCIECDDYAMRFHTMDEPFPPIHPNCVCGMILVY